MYDYNDDNDTATLTARAGGNAPGTPTVRSAEDPGASITVTWDAVETVNGVPVTHYEVQKLVNPWMTIAPKVETTEYTDTNVGPGETHQYRVRAVNGADVPGPWSSPMEGTTASGGGGGTRTVTVYETVYIEVPVRPEGPTELTAEADGEAAVVLEWSGPNRLYDAAVDHYEVEVSGDGVYWTTLAPETTETGYRHEGLEPGDARAYRVYAHNEEGRSLASATACGVIGDGPCTLAAPGEDDGPLIQRPEGPTELTAEADGEADVVLEWSGPNRLYGAAVDYYEVEASEDGEYWKTLAPSVTENTYTHEGLEAGETHHYRVYAHSEGGRSLASVVACGSTDGALGAPCILRVEVDGATVTLSWVSATGADGHLVALVDLADYSYEEYYVDDLPADAHTYTYTSVEAAEYTAFVVAYTGTADDFSELSYDLANLVVE